MSWLRASANSVVLTLHIQPGAKKTEIVGPHGDALKIRLAAPAADGKANAALIEFLSRQLGVTKAAITLVAGHNSRSKRVAVHMVDAKTAVDNLMPPVS